MTTAPERPARALSFEETRQRLGISRTTLFRLLDADAIKSFKLGRTRLFLEEDVESFLSRAHEGTLDYAGRPKSA